jgi:hypothetical protein
MLGKLFLAKAAKDYVSHQVLEDLPRAARKALANVDWDRQVLNRAGLQRLSTQRRVFSGATLFVLGALTGAAAALMLAPRPGAELRSSVRSRAQTLMGGKPTPFAQAPAEA